MKEVPIRGRRARRHRRAPVGVGPCRMARIVRRTVDSRAACLPQERQTTDLLTVEQRGDQKDTYAPQTLRCPYSEAAPDLLGACCLERRCHRRRHHSHRDVLGFVAYEVSKIVTHASNTTRTFSDPVGAGFVELSRAGVHELFLRLGKAGYIEDVLIAGSQNQENRRRSRSRRYPNDVRLAGAEKPASNGKPPQPRDRNRGGSTLRTAPVHGDMKR